MDTENQQQENKLEFTPETVLRRRYKNQKVAEERAKNIMQRMKEGKKKTEDDKFIRAEKIVKEYRNKQKSYKTVKTRAFKAPKVKEDPGYKLALIIRVRGSTNNLSTQALRILKLFRLKRLNSAVFVRLNKATLNMLYKIQPYITYGQPSRKTISDLIYKRGHARIEKKMVQLTSNELVEKHLGNTGMICIEDLVHEIHTIGEGFREANTFLWSFLLNDPKNGYKNKNKPFKSGGDWGNRGEDINELVQQMI